MTLNFRNYQGKEDFYRISEFLTTIFDPEDRYGNWLQPRWEYMHFHPCLDESHLDRIGIWEEDGRIIALANYESVLGEAYFSIHPGYSHLREAMLSYAEEALHGFSEKHPGRKHLTLFISDKDHELEALAKSRGYVRNDGFPQYDSVSRLPILEPFPKIQLPEGYRLKSLAEDNDLHKINRVLWRGFGHEGEPPEEEVEGRKKMQSAPNFRKDLTIVVESPEGTFVSFSGTWFDPVNRIAVVEPVATDPDYRRKGLGKAAVLEGIRRCQVLGATDAYVGSAQPFYLDMGFQPIYGYFPWVRYLDEEKML
jgi:GNAT superfamily N-acetyltransferase